ncbi:MAG TPA: terminase small subunit [Candidatus Krumholzibacteria bacterium]|nr:terminase small subunit [Candidatus Krumholzibacteria bacterium]HPD73526.1 terminase small subunit [Candidatus Krumholzibacteria bacterium]HRY42248.1 terminase small subunit [Candidatus Krumholzibacteria bacterium]
MANKLTPKQEQFCLEYVVDLNATQAAIRAGYSANGADVTGSRLLGNARIATRIAALRSERSAATKITAESVLTRLDQVADRCMQGVEVTDRDGNPIGEWKFDSSGANKALELLGKHLALFVERREVKHDGTIDLAWSPPVPDEGDGDAG